MKLKQNFQRQIVDYNKTTGYRKIEVINDQIIHVAATPDESFSEQKSLAVTGRPESKPSFILAAKQNNVVLSTAKIQVRVSLTSGEVVFIDKDNNVIQRLCDQTGF